MRKLNNRYQDNFHMKYLSSLADFYLSSQDWGQDYILGLAVETLRDIEQLFLRLHCSLV